MAHSSKISMLVFWQNQRREIDITKECNLDMIQHNICKTFGLLQNGSRDQYQVQFYNTKYHHYMDLYPAKWDQFQQLLHTLSTPPSLPGGNREWTLQLVTKMVDTAQVNNTESSSTTGIMIQGAPVDDRSEYQISEDQGEMSIEDSIGSEFDFSVLSTPSNLNGAVGNTVPDISQVSVINNFENTASEPDSNNEHESAALTSTTNLSNNPSAAVHQTLSCHNYNLELKPHLADLQRSQEDSAAIKINSGRASIGGCLLQASGEKGLPVKDKKYFTLTYNIPASMHHLRWCIHLYILTQADQGGNHYLHPSKEILNDDNLKKLIDTYNSQSTTKIELNQVFVTPLVVTLSRDDLKQGGYQVRIKVFNRKGLPGRKRSNLIQFDQIDPVTKDRVLIRANAHTPTQVSLRDLNLNSRKYHLGCILLCENEEVAGLISAMTLGKTRSKNKRIKQ